MDHNQMAVPSLQRREFGKVRRQSLEGFKARHVSREAGHRLLRVVLAMNRCLHRLSPLPALAAFAA
jgi:hypothetical protein